MKLFEKLSELKKEVYRVARVTTTQQLKAKYDSIKPLDMRYKASWEKALEQLNEPEAVETDSTELSAETQTEFEHWLTSPPDEYQYLFAEAEAAFTAIDDKLAKGKKLIKTAKAMVESLNEFAEASLEDSQQLAKITQRRHEDAKQADLN